MKKSLLILCLLPLFTFAQEYSEVVEVPGKTAEQLFKNAKEWFAITFKSANDVIQLNDPASGKIIGKGSMIVTDTYALGGMIKVPIRRTLNTDFTIVISVKEAKYKVEISGINVKPNLQTSESNRIDPDIPFNEFIAQKEYYKNGCDPEWLIKNENIDGKKTPRMYAKSTALFFQSHYNCICKTEENFRETLKSLQTGMKKTEANW